MFKSRAKAIFLETVYRKSEPFVFTIESARVYTLQDTFEMCGVESKTDKVVRFQVHDEPESDDEECDVDF